ncbi:hypothetical protein P43SY_001749 [Pythium insidiosum]|uniref:PWWP domain-containing protein n=1 Tax=Pythium insidiosum TaxID=114742 RepID=A0AAD5M6Y7_PYTIN|nr:hypothetical protein P43SY_001749 [Pythium insidiosum]
MRQRTQAAAAPESAGERRVVDVTLDVGDWLDVMDAEGTWNVAQVLSIPSATEVEVKYDGWGNEYNEIVRLNSDRVAPYHTYTWSVKCWAKYKNWPWWPAIVTIRPPGNDAGSKHLRQESRLFVDFMDRKDITKRCRTTTTYRATFVLVTIVTKDLVDRVTPQAILKSLQARRPCQSMTIAKARDGFVVQQLTVQELEVLAQQAASEDDAILLVPLSYDDDDTKTRAILTDAGLDADATIPHLLQIKLLTAEIPINV